MLASLGVTGEAGSRDVGAGEERPFEDLELAVVGRATRARAMLLVGDWILRFCDGLVFLRIGGNRRYEHEQQGRKSKR